MKQAGLTRNNLRGVFMSELLYKRMHLNSLISKYLYKALVESDDVKSKIYLDISKRLIKLMDSKYNFNELNSLMNNKVVKKK